MAREERRTRGDGGKAHSEVRERIQRLSEAGAGLAARATGLFAGGGLGGLVGQAQTLTQGVQRRVVEVGRGVEGSIERALGSLEPRLEARIEELLRRLNVGTRRDIERLRERVRALEGNLAEVIKRGAGEIVRGLEAGQAAAQALAGTQARLEEQAEKISQLERRIAEINRGTAREALDAEEFRHRLERLEQRLTELAREVGTKLGEQGALRERFTRLENRFVEAVRAESSRSSELAAARERLARLETRLSELSKEQLARTIEIASLKERLLGIDRRSQTGKAEAGAVEGEGPAAREGE